MTPPQPSPIREGIPRPLPCPSLRFSLAGSSLSPLYSGPPPLQRAFDDVIPDPPPQTRSKPSLIRPGIDRRQASPASPAPFFRRLPLPFPQVYALLQDNRGLYDKQTLLAQLALSVRNSEIQAEGAPSRALGFLQAQEPKYATTTKQLVWK